jgi:excisionase family DNA binding protein
MNERDSLLTAEDVATLLGVGRRTVYNMASAGELPGILHVGRRLRFQPRVVRAWLRILGKAARRRQA